MIKSCVVANISHSCKWPSDQLQFADACCFPLDESFDGVNISDGVRLRKIFLFFTSFIKLFPLKASIVQLCQQNYQHDFSHHIPIVLRISDCFDILPQTSHCKEVMIKQINKQKNICIITSSAVRHMGLELIEYFSFRVK